MPLLNTAQSDPALAARITRAASQQTYYTIRFLVDSNGMADAYRAYAYFRWVDDWLDAPGRPDAERLEFLHRQQSLISPDAHLTQAIRGLTPEERLAVDLLSREPDPNSGLQAYFRHLMAVMAFDAERRGRLISQRELSSYTHSLAVAVTEAMHHFIGRSCRSPLCPTRYLAVSGAHITHMLRDTLDDTANGYYNIPRETLEAAQIGLEQINHPAYREWVHKRVDVARACFRAGRGYLAKVQSLRCRVAAFAYMHRFEGVLDCIEQDGYLLRPAYSELKPLGVELIGKALLLALNAPHFERVTGTTSRA